MAKWSDAVNAISNAFPGLIEANLVRLDESTWMDLWRWESHELAANAAVGAPSIQAAADMFSLILELPSIEHGEVVLRRKIG